MIFIFIHNIILFISNYTCFKIFTMYMFTNFICQLLPTVNRFISLQKYRNNVLSSYHLVPIIYNIMIVLKCFVELMRQYPERTFSSINLCQPKLLCTLHMYNMVGHNTLSDIWSVVIHKKHLSNNTK